jgi:hypothetical protein
MYQFLFKFYNVAQNFIGNKLLIQIKDNTRFFISKFRNFRENIEILQFRNI